MKDILEQIIKECQDNGAEYVDVRIENNDNISIIIENSSIQSISAGNDYGVGIRVLKNGSWGFAYGPISDKNKLINLALKSVVLTSRFKKEDVILTSAPTIEDKINVSMKENPIDSSLEEKTSIALTINENMKKNEIVKSTRVIYREKIQNKFFGNSDGSYIEMKVPYVFVQGLCTVKDGNGETLQARASLGHIGGMEIFREDPPESVGERALKDATEGIKAPKVKGGKYSVVMDGSMNGLFAHEAVGHASEGDFCRTAGVLRGKLNKKVAASNTSLVDDGSLLEVNGDRFFGYIPYDDEGVKPKRVDIIEDGILRHYLTDRASSKYWGLDLTGNARAENYSSQSIVRMRNTWLEATKDPFSREELIEEVKNGLLIKKSTGGQVDPVRGTFNFGTGEIWTIEKGEVKERRRPTTCAGNTLQTLKNIIGINNEFDKPQYSIGFCGKQGQSVPTSIVGGWIAVKNVVIGG